MILALITDTWVIVGSLGTWVAGGSIIFAIYSLNVDRRHRIFDRRREIIVGLLVLIGRQIEYVRYMEAVALNPEEKEKQRITDFLTDNWQKIRINAQMEMQDKQGNAILNEVLEIVSYLSPEHGQTIEVAELLRRQAKLEQHCQAYLGKIEK